MSKLKTPHQKKKASYDRDRRKPAGARTKFARKELPRRKARAERAVRHEVHKDLNVVGAPVEALDGDALDAAVGAVRRKQVAAAPDLPLLEYIERQKTGRTARAGRKPKR